MFIYLMIITAIILYNSPIISHQKIVQSYTIGCAEQFLFEGQVD